MSPEIADLFFPRGVVVIGVKNSKISFRRNNNLSNNNSNDQQQPTAASAFIAFITGGQSYKGSKIVIYNSRVVITPKFQIRVQINFCNLRWST